MNILSAVLGPVADLAKGYLANKQAEKQATHERKLEHIKNDADWEAKMAAASDSSWKDEFWTIILAAPIFFVGYAIAVDDLTVIDRVKAGFEALSELPEYYQYLLFIAISASFGIKGVGKLMSLRK